MNRMDEMYAHCVEQLKQTLALAKTVALTIDIWSDRRMGGYLGVTVHYLKGK